MRLSFFLTSVLLCASSVSAQNPPLAKTPTAAPTNDSFMIPPSGWQSTKPGAILSVRRLPTNSTIVQSNLTSSILQFLYRSTDANNQPNTQVVTVFSPNSSIAQPTKHLAYSFAYDSAWINCDPSFGVQNGANGQFTFLGKTEVKSINMALAKGYFVSTSDYEGSKAAFTNGKQSGQGVLDQVRAIVANSGKYTGISTSAKTVLWGYSGGALASEWASELQASYAPDVKLAGAALGGLTPNVTEVATLINKSFFAGIIPSGVWGIAAQFQNLTDYVNQHLRANVSAKFHDALKQCLLNDVLEFQNTDIFGYFDGDGSALFNAPVPASIINSVGIMGLHGTPKFPIFAYKAIKDQVSAVNSTDALVQKLCKQGANIYYARDTKTDHLGLLAAGQVEAFNFVDGILNGTGSIPKGCTTVTTNL